jgi:hypothetical protein
MLRSTAFLTISLAAAAASAQTATAPDDTRPPTINQRLENHHDRIEAGIKDDQLTKNEAAHLRADDAASRAQKRVYRKANDGTLTRGERRQLRHELNQNSRQIRRDRHNNRKPRS